MPYLKVFVHCVWATKDRAPLMTKTVRNQIFEHIAENAKSKNIVLLEIGGHTDHCHFLYSMDAAQNIATVMNLIKGESSFWVNKQKLTSQKFEWQDDYFAVSVSPDVIPRVCRYIKNQETHHRKKTFQQEYDEFLVKCGFEIIQG